MPRSLISSVSARPSRAPWLAFIALAAAVALLWHGPVPQWASYHHFADARQWLGIPNAANVLSNLPFAVIGAWGVWRLWRLRDAVSGRPGWHGWVVFGVAVACTAAGSAIYHFDPSNATLVLDRLPIAWACAALMCAFLAERVDPRWAGPPALVAAVVSSSLAVAWWWWSEQQGQGDLRAYLFVQFLPMLLVPGALLMRLQPGSPSVVNGRVWWTVLLLYAAAKLMEVADRTVLDAIVITSGHTLKHLLAAGAAACVLGAASAPSKR